MKTIKITVCICTYKRYHLKDTLLSLQQQEFTSPIQLDFVIVDNDKEGFSKEIVNSVIDKIDFSFQYVIEPEKNISLARNRSVSLACGEYIFFMDDDETADPDLIQISLDALIKHNADLVLGSVQSRLPQGTPSWVESGQYFEKRLPETGTILEFASTCNLLVNRAVLLEMPAPFSREYGLTGGGDTELTYRLHRHGCKIIAFPEAIVTEEVEVDRLNLDYLIRRAIRGGETYIRAITNHNSVFEKIKTIVKTSLLLPFFLLLFILHVPLGKAYYIRWLLRGCSQFGKLRALFSSRKIEIYSS